MSQPNKPKMPVVLLAFASDLPGQFLRSITDEHDSLTTILRSAEKAGQCEVIAIASANTQKIVDAFQQNRGAIRLFHYGGHADGFGLLVSSAPGQEVSVDGKSFAAFIAAQEGLELVFLNGCSSQGQADDLLAAGVRTVIATSEAINDQAAKQFSQTFYTALVTGATVTTAFDEASQAVLMGASGKTRGLYWEEAKVSKSQNPWNVFGDEESDWKLTEAARDVQLLNTIETVRSLHVKANTEQAIKALTTFLKERNHPLQLNGDQIQTAFSNNKRANMMGTISHADYTLTTNQISARLLSLLDEMAGK